MKLRICRISQNFRPENDGLSRHVLTLSEHQTERGHHVYLFQPFVHNTKINGIELVKVNTGNLREHVGYKLYTLLFCLAALRTVWLHNRRIKFDIIHCHGDAIEAFCFGLIGRFMSIPVVLTVHGGLNRGKLYKATAPFLFRFVDRFVPISNPVRCDLERVRVSPERIRVISTGINYREFESICNISQRELRQKLGMPQSSIVIATAGRLHPVKGFEYLIAAALKFHGDSAPLFYVVGDGPDRVRLSEKAAGMRHFFLTGRKSHTEMLQYLRCADIFVMCSVDFPWQSEAIPTVLIEALALGLPVVTTDAGEGRYLVKTGVNGFIVEQRDPESLYSAIREMIVKVADPQYKKQVSVYNKNLAAERDWGVLVERVEDVYRELMKNSPA